ncbi:MAG: cupin domain-containing protein, partial [Clostridia bacterium]|nr:cupin domain-containing protein [Clostridia bacterium]
MIYQSVLLGRIPYVTRKMKIAPFQLHFHHEIELLYCLNGKFTATVDGIPRSVGKGELLFIESMKPHAVTEADDAEAFLVELGPMFLGENFSTLASLSFHTPALRREEQPALSSLFSLLDEAVVLWDKTESNSELLRLGNLYGLCAALISAGQPTGVSAGRRTAQELEKVLILAHTDYKRNITVEEAAALAGYGKSNFCKLFKSLMGMSFHTYLNRFRIE